MCNRDLQGDAGAHQHYNLRSNRDPAPYFHSNHDRDRYCNSDGRRNVDSDADRYPNGCYRDCDSHAHAIARSHAHGNTGGDPDVGAQRLLAVEFTGNPGSGHRRDRLCSAGKLARRHWDRRR
jgi:hypothetical protein